MTKAEIIEECRAVFESSPQIGFEEIAYKPYPGTDSHDIATALHGKGFDGYTAKQRRVIRDILRYSQTKAMAMLAKRSGDIGHPFEHRLRHFPLAKKSIWYYPLLGGA